VEPGESASFPTKWMSPDGKTIHLVFSGGDSFNVRQATLTVAEGQPGNKRATAAPQHQEKAK
jgi:hypothetical protein